MTAKTKTALVVGACSLVGLAMLLPHIISPKMVRSQASCLTELRMIDGAKQEWAREHHKSTNDIPTWSDLAEYFSRREIPRCPAGGSYTIGRVDQLPRCSFPEHGTNYASHL